jgi:uncharacterized protein (UPF0128 family)
MTLFEELQGSMYSFPKTEIGNDLTSLANHMCFVLQEDNIKQEILKTQPRIIIKAISNWAQQEVKASKVEDIRRKFEEYANSSNQGNPKSDWDYVFTWLPKHICDNYIKIN